MRGLKKKLFKLKTYVHTYIRTDIVTYRPSDQVVKSNIYIFVIFTSFVVNSAPSKHHYAFTEIIMYLMNIDIDCKMA